MCQLEVFQKEILRRELESANKTYRVGREILNTPFFRPYSEAHSNCWGGPLLLQVSNVSPDQSPTRLVV